MPGTPTLRIDESDGTTRASIDCLSAQRTDSLVEMWTATATVDRETWLNVYGSVDEVNDKLYILRGDGTTLFAGRFADDTRNENNVDVTLNSPEQDAIDAEPTGGRAIYNNVNDSAVATDAINSVPSLTAGTVDTIESSVSFTFANAEQSKVLRDAAQPGGADLRYDFDWTVDFLDRLGSDKPNTTISSAGQDIVEELSVVDDSRDPVTHIKGLGAQQGPDQVTATATIASYSGGDKQVWRKYENKDIIQQDRLQAIVDRLASEFDSERRRIVIETRLVGVDVSLGDRVTVDLDEHNIDRLLRVTEITEVVGPDGHLLVTLTNRDPERGGDRKRRDDLERFNSGDQGFIDRDNDSYGWQPVNASTNATRPYHYPDDVVTEVEAKAVVKSIPYRAFSSGSASGGDHTHDVDLLTTSADNSEFENVNIVNESAASVTVGTSWTDVSSITPSEFTSQLVAFVTVRNPDSAGAQRACRLRLNNETTGTIFPDSTGVTVPPLNVGEQTAMYLLDSTDTNGETLTVQAERNASADMEFQIVWFGVGQHTHTVAETETSDASGPHTHDPEPGLIEFGGETASGVGLAVNGTGVANNIGSGSFTTTVDISGELSSGENTIQVSSDSLGLINITVITQLFRTGREVP